MAPVVHSVEIARSPEDVFGYLADLEYDPPRKSAFRGLNGPVRPVGTVTVESVVGHLRASLSASKRCEDRPDQPVPPGGQARSSPSNRRRRTSDG